MSNRRLLVVVFVSLVGLIVSLAFRGMAQESVPPAEVEKERQMLEARYGADAVSVRERLEELAKSLRLSESQGLTTTQPLNELREKAAEAQRAMLEARKAFEEQSRAALEARRLFEERAALEEQAKPGDGSVDEFAGKFLFVEGQKLPPSMLEKASIRQIGQRTFIVGTIPTTNPLLQSDFPGSTVWLPIDAVTRMVIFNTLEEIKLPGHDAPTPSLFP